METIIVSKTTTGRKKCLCKAGLSIYVAAKISFSAKKIQYSAKNIQFCVEKIQLSTKKNSI